MGAERWARADDGALVRVVFAGVGGPGVAAAEGHAVGGGGVGAEADGVAAAVVAAGSGTSHGAEGSIGSSGGDAPSGVGAFEAGAADWWEGRSERPQWWPPIGLVPIPAPPVDAAADAMAVTVSVDSAGGRDRLESDLGLFAAEHLVDLVAVHAAVMVVAGRLIVLPGPSFTGKSTLCAAAVAAGHEVWSDEYALVDPATGAVTGWPRRIKLRNPDGTTQRIDIGDTSLRAPRRADLVAFVAYDETADPHLEVGGITAGDAAMRLLENTVCARVRPGDALGAATALARSCTAVAGKRPSADATLAALLA